MHIIDLILKKKKRSLFYNKDKQIIFYNKDLSKVAAVQNQLQFNLNI